MQLIINSLVGTLCVLSVLIPIFDCVEGKPHKKLVRVFTLVVNECGNYKTQRLIDCVIDNK